MSPLPAGIYFQDEIEKIREPFAAITEDIGTKLSNQIIA